MGYLIPFALMFMATLLTGVALDWQEIIDMTSWGDLRFVLLSGLIAGLVGAAKFGR